MHLNKKPITKNLRFEVNGKVYSDFWYIGTELFGLRKKNDIFAELVRVVKEQKRV